ncbi:hypothetical protein CK203_072377 [Vitis vinifera]|uniref:DUF4283 domain-containing protein n=1 Tax=Vitis vinifera TaxID=29760 RepID=A0A438E880_VITVI|nr:hypothetical protein CK203_072377 [Vitis vinifera]
MFGSKRALIRLQIAAWHHRKRETASDRGVVPPERGEEHFPKARAGIGVEEKVVGASPERLFGGPTETKIPKRGTCRARMGEPGRRSFWYGRCLKNRSPGNFAGKFAGKFASGEWFLTTIRLTGSIGRWGRRKVERVHLGEMQRTNLLDQIWGCKALVVCWLELRLAVEVVLIEVGPLVWEEERRKYSLERRSNEAGRFLLCSVRDLEAKCFCLIFPEGKGLFGGWNILAKKLREVGVVPTGGLKDPFSIEVVQAWLLKGRLNIIVLGRGLLPFEFELLSEVERVLARGKRRVKENVLFMEKWYPEGLTYLCSDCGWVEMFLSPSVVGNPRLGFLRRCRREGFLGRGFQWLKKKQEEDLVSRAVLEKEVQSKVQTGVQVVPPCGSSSKSATSFSSDYSAKGYGPKGIDGEKSLKNRGQGAGGVAKVGGHGSRPEELKIGTALWEA